jgi:EmrB/QacA subfamily drug resistance transporter
MTFLRTRRHSDHYKWWVLSCTSVGMLVATLNSGTLIIALPDLERSLHTTLLQLVWVILVYMITSTVLMLNAGRLSDMFGRKHAYVLGFAVFTLASLGAGFSGSGTELILWRIVQGIGAAFLFANSGALVTDAFPKRQLGLAMGTTVMVGAIGLVIGPVLGGALVTISWPWVFWFNVPLGILGSVWAYLVLQEKDVRSSERGLDLPGTTAFVLGLTGLVLALSKGGLSGWSDPLVIGGFAAAIVLLPLFVLIEWRSRSPILDLSLFKDRLFAAASVTVFLNGFTRFALTFLFVFYFQGPQGQSPIMAGIELSPFAIGMLVASPLAGIAADRRGSRTLAALGMLISAIGIAGMTTLEAHTSYWWSALWLALVGIGSGVFNSPNTSAMMGAVPVHRRGIASGVRVMLMNVGTVISVAFVMAMITSAVPMNVLLRIFSGLASGLTAEQLAPFISNMHLAFWVLAAVSAAGAAISMLRPAHVRTAERADAFEVAA